jgi:hypothetical protein
MSDYWQLVLVSISSTSRGLTPSTVTIVFDWPLEWMLWGIPV